MPGHGKDFVETEFHARKPATHGPPPTEEVSASRPRSPPSSGYRKLSAGKAGMPEFHAQTHPPGTAPPSKSYYPAPNADPDVLSNANLAEPLDIPGATSQSVHNASQYVYGKPLQGQTARERRGPHGDRTGLEGVGASAKGEAVEDKVRRQAGDLDVDAKGTRGKSGSNRGDWPPAEDRVPEPARSRQWMLEQETD